MNINLDMVLLVSSMNLKTRGIPCTRVKVVEFMNDMNLIAKARKKYKFTTDSNHNKQIAPNLLAQDFIATEPNQRWVLILACRAKRLER
jgi:putative transposase